MNAPTLALGWLLLGRHRRGLAVVVVSWLLCLILTAVVPADVRPSLLSAGASAVLPFSLLYLFMVFAYGFDGIPLEGANRAFRPGISPCRCGPSPWWAGRCWPAAWPWD